MKGCQNLLIVDLVNGLNFRHPINVNILSDIGKNDHHGFQIGLALPCFFFLGEMELFQCMDWHLVSINKLHVSLADLPNFVRNFTLTRYCTLTLNIIPTELR
jgi:hypothetical protein